MTMISLADFLKRNNLVCRTCTHRQVANVDSHKTGTSHYVKYYNCLNCGQLNLDLIRFWATGGGSKNGMPIPYQQHHEVVVKFPRLTRPFRLPPKCPTDLSEDYLEAAKLLEDSPRASSAFSRRCLQGILEKNGYQQKTLYQQVEALLGETDPKKALPIYIAESVDAIRNFGNFSAHPILDQNSSAVVPVEPGEADWSLQIVEELIEHYYERPERERQRRDELNKKLESAGKPPILRPKDSKTPDA